MTYPLARSAFHKGFNIEKRLVRRRAVGIRARLRDATARFDVDVTDLSTLGFRTETSFTLWPGARIWLTLPGFAGLEAAVAWRDRYRYGCAFARPLHEAVVDHIVTRNWA